MGFCVLGLGFMKKNNRKMGIGFQFEQHRLGLCDLSWDLKKTISREVGLGPPLHDPLNSPFRVYANFAYTLREVSVLPKNTTQSPRAGLNPGPLNPNPRERYDPL